MQPTTGSLAAHFPTRRRIFGTPGADSDALVKQAQAELKLASEEAKKTVFRFNFDLTGDLDDAPKKKKKNKKKKKKTKTKDAAAQDGTVDLVAGAAKSESVAAAPVAVTSDPAAKLKTAPAPAKKPAANTKAKPAAKTKATTAAPTPKKIDKKAGKAKSQSPMETPAPAAESPGFLKLRKPTNSDSEVMKMQLRYGRGKRNLAAKAQRDKKKKEQQQSPEEASSEASSSGFQFNFFS